MKLWLFRTKSSRKSLGNDCHDKQYCSATKTLVGSKKVRIKCTVQINSIFCLPTPLHLSITTTILYTTQRNLEKCMFIAFYNTWFFDVNRVFTCFIICRTQKSLCSRSAQWFQRKQWNKIIIFRSNICLWSSDLYNFCFETTSKFSVQ